MAEFDLETEFVKVEDSAQKQQDGKALPLVLVAGQDRLNFVQLQEFLISRGRNIFKAASHFGAVLFKNFDVASVEEWSSVLHQCSLQQQVSGVPLAGDVALGNNPRTRKIQISTSDEMELNQIFANNELGHSCLFSPKSAGEDGVVFVIRSDEVYQYVKEKHPQFAETLEQLGVKLIRVMPEADDPSSPLRSWKSTFNVSTCDEAQRKFTNTSASWEWLPNGDCKVTSGILPAVQSASSGSKYLSNYIVYAGANQVVLGDGTPLNELVMADIAAYTLANQRAIHWESGAFLIIDSAVVAFSRSRFSGPQPLVAAVAGGQNYNVGSERGTCLVLPSGDAMPAVGLGLWKVAPDACAATVVEAVKAGYRCFDSACDYANEEQTGAGLREAMGAGLVRREELFITSKLWNTYHRRQHVRLACLRTLSDLGLEYLDLYLIHFPISLKFVPFEERYPPEWWTFEDGMSMPGLVEDAVPMRETWEAMEQLVRDGLVRNIGVCNIGTLMLRDILTYATIKPALIQVELHPYLTQDKLLRFCREKGIAVTGFSSFGGTSYVEVGMAQPTDSLLTDPTIRAIAERIGRTPAQLLTKNVIGKQVLLRWGVQRGTAVIPKTVNPTRMAENLRLFDFSLSPDDMAAISSLNKNRRFNDPGDFCEAAYGAFCPIFD